MMEAIAASWRARERLREKGLAPPGETRRGSAVAATGDDMRSDASPSLSPRAPALPLPRARSSTESLPGAPDSFLQ